MANTNALRAVEPLADLRIVAPRPGLDDTKHHYAVCRSLGHSWVHRGVDREAYDGAMIGLRSECSHCGMTRTVFRTPSGFRSPNVQNRYTPPPEYADRGDDKLQRNEWVQLMLSDVLPMRGATRSRRRAR